MLSCVNLSIYAIVALSYRHLQLYAMEKSAIKNWKRHRDVPVTIDELVDKTFDDLRDRRLDLTNRSQVNAIKPEKLIKVNNLLDDIRRVVEKEVLQESYTAFIRLGNKLKQLNDIDHATEIERVDGYPERYHVVPGRY
jgi:hypothetical protein